LLGIILITNNNYFKQNGPISKTICSKCKLDIWFLFCTFILRSYSANLLTPIGYPRSNICEFFI